MWSETLTEYIKPYMATHGAIPITWPALTITARTFMTNRAPIAGAAAHSKTEDPALGYFYTILELLKIAHIVARMPARAAFAPENVS